MLKEPVLKSLRFRGIFVMIIFDETQTKSTMDTENWNYNIWIVFARFFDNSDLFTRFLDMR